MERELRGYANSRGGSEWEMFTCLCSEATKNKYTELRSVEDSKAEECR